MNRLLLEMQYLEKQLDFKIQPKSTEWLSPQPLAQPFALSASVSVYYLLASGSWQNSLVQSEANSEYFC